MRGLLVALQRLNAGSVQRPVRRENSDHNSHDHAIPHSARVASVVQHEGCNDSPQPQESDHPARHCHP